MPANNSFNARGIRLPLIYNLSHVAVASGGLQVLSALLIYI
jgi:hypothetical protein